MFTKHPCIIETDGVKIPVDPDFRIMCRYSAAVLRGDKEAIAKAAEAFYFAGLPDEISPERAAKEMQDFYISGLAPGKREEKEEKNDKENADKQPVNPCFDFEEDEGYFYAAFLGEYGIDLTTVKKMHWFNFCALFMGLPDECKLKRIILIRTQNLNDEKTTAGKQRLQKLKRVFGLKLSRPPSYRSLEERNAAMVRRLLKQQEMLREKGAI